MSLDRSLKGKSTLERHRNVLRRAERVAVLEDAEKWSENNRSSVFGLVKVAHRKVSAAKKPAKAEATEGATATVAAPSAAGAKAAPAAAAPAAKAKK